MLRKLKTNLTKEDLIRPTIDVGQANADMKAQNTGSGGLVLPMQKQISDVLTQAAKPVSDDWKKVGDPNAPAIREMEAIRLMEKQQAEAMAAKAATPPPVIPAGGQVMDIMPAAAPVVNAPTSADDHSRQPYAWMPKPAAPTTPKPDDIPDIWSKPSPLDNMTIPTAVPAGIVPRPVQPVTATELPPESVSLVAAAPIAPAQPMVMPMEGVIYIPHDPSKTIKPATTIPAPEPPKEGDFASGAAVTIPHDSPMQSLPYSPPATKPKVTGAAI